MKFSMQISQLARQAQPWCPSRDPLMLSLAGPLCICTPGLNTQLSCVATASRDSQQIILSKCRLSYKILKTTKIHTFICRSFYNLSPTYFFSPCPTCSPSLTQCYSHTRLSFLVLCQEFSSSSNHTQPPLANCRALAHPPGPSKLPPGHLFHLLTSGHHLLLKTLKEFLLYLPYGSDPQ